MGTVTNYPEFHARRRLKAEAHGRQFLPYGAEQAELDLDMSLQTFKPVFVLSEKSHAQKAHEEIMEKMRSPNVTSGHISIVDSIRRLFRGVLPDNQDNRRDR